MPNTGSLYQHERMVATYLALREACSGAQNFVRVAVAVQILWEAETSHATKHVLFMGSL